MDRVRSLVGVSNADGITKTGMPTGKGIGIAVVDTGISAHIDFGTGKNNRILSFVDFVNGRRVIYDDCGHGTHVSGIIAGNGMASKGKYVGIAPEAGIVALKTLDSKGSGKISHVLNALDWILENKEKYNIRIVNISMGAGEGSNYNENNKLILGIEKVWDEGMVVCVAAGNNGPGNTTITMPGICRKIITIGCMDDDKEVIMNNIKVINYSGRGPTASAIMKPEVVAPGGNVFSCGGGYRNYVSKSGTSMATPVVSGLIALVLEINPDLTNVQIKKLIKSAAKDTGEDKYKQGWGQIDINNMIKYAKLI